MALWKDMLVLGTEAEKDNNDPYQSGEIIWGSPLFANRQPVHASEFHAAQAEGREVQHMFEVRPAEYTGETFARYDGQVYQIYRTYQKAENVIELYLSDKRA
ncbi:MAG: head-tail adaptor protein [Clostridiales bacterium]|nr:head-tail adaptor protein [Clostridiales bacterium]